MQVTVSRLWSTLKTLTAYNVNCLALLWTQNPSLVRMFCGRGSLLSLGLRVQTRRGKKKRGNFFCRDTKTAQNLTPHSSWDTQGAPIFQVSSLLKHKWSVNVPYLYPNEGWDKVKEAEIADNIVLEWAVIIIEFVDFEQVIITYFVSNFWTSHYHRSFLFQTSHYHLFCLKLLNKSSSSIFFTLNKSL